MSNQAVTHSKYSFSARKRWASCSVSVLLSQGIGDQAGTAAEEGTIAHTVGEFYVRQRFNLPGALSGESPNQNPPAGLGLVTADEINGWNTELREHGRAYAAFIASLIPEGQAASVALEMKVAIPSISPYLFGTGDCFIWIPGLRRLIVVDYKYGYAAVELGTVNETNPQIAAYLVAAVETFGLDPADLGAAVHQPRKPSAAETPLTLPIEWLPRERAKLTAEVAAIEAATLDTPPVPGNHCRYCRAAKVPGRCSAATAATQTALAAHAGDVKLHEIDDATVIALWSARSAFKPFWEDIEARIANMAQTGHKRLEVKTAQGQRMWADPAKATLTLLALGRHDLLKPCALSEALPIIPEPLHAELIKRARGSTTIKVLDPDTPRAASDMFAKYAATNAKTA